MLQDKYPLTLYADQEHERLRTAVVFLLLFLLIIIFSVSRSIFSSASGIVASYNVALSCVISPVLALSIVWLVEQYLKTVWHSGNSIVITIDSITAVEKGQPDIVISRQAELTRFEYYFRLDNVIRNGRERRESRDALCLASEIVQGENQFVVYTYMPEKSAVKWTESFRELDPHAEIGNKKERKSFAHTRTVPIELLRGKDGRYWLAEQHRWKTGMELTAADFEVFMEESGRKG